MKTFVEYNERAEKAAVAEVAELLGELHTIFHAGLTASQANERLEVIYRNSWITPVQYWSCVRILNGVLNG